MVKDKGNIYYVYVHIRFLCITFVSGFFQGFQIQEVKGLNHFIEFTHTRVV